MANNDCGNTFECRSAIKTCPYSVGMKFDKNAYVPAVTVCTLGLCPVLVPNVGGFSKGYSKGFNTLCRNNLNT